MGFDPSDEADEKNFPLTFDDFVELHEDYDK